VAISVIELKEILKQHFPDATVEIQDLLGDSDHYSITIISARFENKSKIERHRMVHDALLGVIGNKLHALTISALVPDSEASISADRANIAT
jgi:stress-induced morphogen